MSKKTAKAKRKPAKKQATSSKKSAKPARSSKSPGARGSAKSTTLRDQGLELFRFAQKMINDMCGGIPAEKCTAQVAPANNHVLWTYGHLAMTNDWLASLVDGKPKSVPDSYEKLFGFGSTPVNDPSSYPALADVKREYEKASKRLTGGISRLDDAGLQSKTEGDGFGFANNKGDCLLKAAWHEGWHLGQIADLRRGLGLSKLMG